MTPESTPKSTDLTKPQQVFLLLVNPVAGKHIYLEKLEEIVGYLKESKHTYRIYLTEKENPVERLKKFFQNNQDITDIVIIGGDGTINICLNAIPHFNFTFNVISNGTGNDAVKNFQPELDFRKQAISILKGKTTTIDVGTCNDRYFINGVGIGFDGCVVEKLNKRKLKKHGHWAYLSIVLQLLPFPRYWKVKMDIDGKKIAKKIFSVTATKGSTFGGGFVTNPNAKNDDGLLDVCIIKKITLIEKLLVMPWVFKGKHGWSRKVEFLKCKSFEVHSDKKIKAHMDGEFFESDTFQFNVFPKKLSVRI